MGNQFNPLSNCIAGAQEHFFAVYIPFLLRFTKGFFKTVFRAMRKIFVPMELLMKILVNERLANGSYAN